MPRILFSLTPILMIICSSCWPQQSLDASHKDSQTSTRVTAHSISEKHRYFETIGSPCGPLIPHAAADILLAFPFSPQSTGRRGSHFSRGDLESRKSKHDTVSSNANCNRSRTVNHIDYRYRGPRAFLLKLEDPIFTVQRRH